MHLDAQPFLLKERQKRYESFLIYYRQSPQIAEGSAYTYKYAESGQIRTQQKYFNLDNPSEKKIKHYYTNSEEGPMTSSF